MKRRLLGLISGSAVLTMAMVAEAQVMPEGGELRVAETKAVSGKGHRASESARPSARVAPRLRDAAPADPIAAAFALFPGTAPETRDDVASGVDATPMVTVPMPPAPVVAVAVEPGVVAVERFDPTPAPPAMMASYAPIEPVAPAIEQALRTDPIPVLPAARPADGGRRALAVPVPRRKPVMTAAEKSGAAMRLASLEPADEIPGRQETVLDAAPIAAEVTALGEPKRIPKEALPYLALLRREAAANKVPLWLAVGVGWVESKYNPTLRGNHGVVGLMQVMPSTARFQGYKGPTDKLMEAETNIVWGMKELGWDWAKSGGNPCLAIAKYKGGIATRGITGAAADYCRRAKTVTGML